jgi:hypothetical protein
MIELNPEAALYESRMRIARANSRASLLASLGALDLVAPPAPLSSPVNRPLRGTVELRQPVAPAAFDTPRAA